MSEPFDHLSGDLDYWMGLDLLDACYDPMPVGMDLGGRPLLVVPPFVPPNIAKMQGGWQDIEKNPTDFNVPPDTDAANFSGPLVESDSSPGTTGDGLSSSDYKKQHVCSVCRKDFEFRYLLKAHALFEFHDNFACPIPHCGKCFISDNDLCAHSEAHRINSHKPTSLLFDCAECGESLLSKTDVLRHAKESQHQPYACVCGARFSRPDVLKRHIHSVTTTEPLYPCNFCRRHRGADGFRRKDHLTQHMRNYHHHDLHHERRLMHTFPVCPHPQCPQHRVESFKKLPTSLQLQQKPFATQSAFTKHMRYEHNESAFPCDVAGCDRVGRKGYAREKSLKKHRQDSHPEMPYHQARERDRYFTCGGCGKKLASRQSLTVHESGWNGELKCRALIEAFANSS